MSSRKRYRSSSPSTSKRHLASEEQTQDDRSGCEIEVFLSFCGKDTRKNLTDFLYQSLIRAGIHTFRDDDELQKGDNIETIFCSIEQSKISIPIFSTNYASREWCMLELAKMIECRNTKKQRILPIFYDIKPSVVREQSDSFNDALLKHEERFGNKTIRKWKKALREVGSIKGWVSDECFDGHQGKLVQDVVSTVWKELKKHKLQVPDHNILGIEYMERSVMELLDTDADDTRMVGIYGGSGAGKTILSKLIYNKISDGFERCSFVANIREKSEKHGLEYLQKQLIIDVLGGNCSDKIHNVDDGISIISQRFHTRKVLILLDDVDQREHLDALAKECNWFGLGSRIIVTTRNREMLKASQIYGFFEVTNPNQVNNPKQSLKLLLHRNIEGERFYEYTDAILASLRKNEISRIGIHGLGGVGKTTLAMNIHDHLIQHQSSFREIFWVLVSYDCTPRKLQSRIGKAVGVNLSGEDDLYFRAAKLSATLNEIRNFVLFLDDVWAYFQLELMGVSNEMKGCKVILTSRSIEVCRRMGCNEYLRINPLPEFAAWNLFNKTIGHETKLSGEINQIAHSITDECGGLPLGIITMASSMRGVDDIHEWRDSLQLLKEAKEGPEYMDLEVFPVLKFSYDRLRDRQAQQCLLYCAVFPEDHAIEREVVIELLIDVGLIKEADRDRQIDRGHTILNKLENSCLLEKVTLSFGRAVKMHDLIRDMALRISKSKFMVKSGQLLQDPPDAEEWDYNVEVVSLMINAIKEISFSPKCHRLSVLLLNQNSLCSGIQNCFFDNLRALTVLHLSNTSIVRLPNSVANLVNLTTLVVRGCQYLERIPSLAKLSSLRKMDLSHTAIKEVPDGMENMAYLRHLDLYCQYLEKIPAGIVPKLSKIRHFVILWPKGDAEVLKKGELGSLKKLETLKIQFQGLHEYKAFARSTIKPDIYYVIFSGTFDLSVIQSVVAPKGICKFVEVNLYLSLVEDLFISSVLPLPEDAQGIRLHGRCFKGSLGELLSRNNVFNLKYCAISENSQMESLLSSRLSTPVISLGALLLRNYGSNFEYRQVSEDSKMESPVSFPVPPPQISILPGKIFSNLTCLHITGSGIERLFETALLPDLQNLEVLNVCWCEQLEEIIAEKEVMRQRPATEDEDTITLPKLRRLNLFSLPSLKRISKTMLACDSLQTLEIGCCPQLTKIPLFLKSVNGQLSPPSSLMHIRVTDNNFDDAKRWWESLGWDVPAVKKVLEPLVILPSPEKILMAGF